MTTLEIFKEVFGENVFVASRKREIVDKRIAAYTCMHILMKMKYREISELTGRSHATIINGEKRFKGLLQVGDKKAKKIWKDMNVEIVRLLARLDEREKSDGQFGEQN